MKSELRKQFLGARGSIPTIMHSKASESLCRHLTQLDLLSYDHIFAFYPFKGEPDIRPFLSEHAGRVSLPRVGKGRTLTFHEFTSDTELVANQLGIPEPPESSAATQATERSVFLIPAVAISYAGVRLGYGGGYYDRYFAAHTRSRVIAVVFDNFLVAELPQAPHDVIVDGAVTESGYRDLPQRGGPRGS